MNALASRLQSIALVAVATMAVAGCGRDAGRSDRSTPTTSAPGTSTPGTSAPDTSSTLPASSYPTDPDVALVTIGRDGNMPTLVIGGDGWVYYPTAESPALGITARSAAGVASERDIARPAAIPPPPAPTPVERRHLTPEGIAIVMGLADQLGLLAPPATYDDPGVTDMSTTEVTLVDRDGTYVHSAYALGFADEGGNRKDLLDFVNAAGDLDTLVGDDNFGAAQAYVPDTFSVSPAPFPASEGVVAWPAGVPVEQGCVQLPIDRFPAGVAGIYAADVAGTSTHIAVVPDLPGDACS
jgi:hypothetical protein